MTIIGVAILLSPVLVRTWRDFKGKHCLMAEGPTRAAQPAAGFHRVHRPLAVIAAFPFVWTLWGSFKVAARFLFQGRLDQRDHRHTNTRETHGGPFTGAGYDGAWVQEEFWRAAINTFIVCFFVVAPR
jgi:ABC-type glycerol-3-phosphate transport system permease component